jgi:hypothetical protein
MKSRMGGEFSERCAGAGKLDAERSLPVVSILEPVLRREYLDLARAFRCACPARSSLPVPGEKRARVRHHAPRTQPFYGRVFDSIHPGGLDHIFIPVR